MFDAKRICTGHIFVIICLLFFHACSHSRTTAYADNGGYFGSLQQRLVREGFDEARIRGLYRQPRATFETQAVALYFVHNEGKLNYGQFLDRGSVEKARIYMNTHKADLEKAEKAYGVDPKIITAILSVETRLGRYTGKTGVFNILSTMAALADPKVREMLWGKISSSTRLTRKAFEDKAEEKSDWAYNELRSFLTYTAKENLDPLKIKGSYAGAMGFCQFMPSNILTLARDGNNDGRIDLFSHVDAIISIANYLKHYGWHPGIERKKAYEVVYSYNHSSYYVNTILKIAERL